MPIELDETDDCDLTGVTGVELTSGGTFTLTAIIRDNTAGAAKTIPTSLLQEGSVELKVIDTSGSEGTVFVEVPTRTITVTPLVARPRDTVTISGQRFIADNPDGDSVTVDVKYECGTKSRTATADPDVSGNWTETLRIPDDCSIPSTNTITAEIKTDDGATGVVETVTHSIPQATVTVTPGSGIPGGKVSVSGLGFRTFETVEKVQFGGKGTLGGRTETTDGNGNFTVTDIVIPGLDPGTHSVTIEVGVGSDRTTASASFTVLGAGTPTGVPTPVVDAVAPLGDSLVRVFNFNNVTKTWTFYDPRPEFADANTIVDLVSNEVYWINVTEDQTGVLLNSQSRDLSCSGDDCWNLLVW